MPIHWHFHLIQAVCTLCLLAQEQTETPKLTFLDKGPTGCHTVRHVRSLWTRLCNGHCKLTVVTWKHTQSFGWKTRASRWRHCNYKQISWRQIFMLTSFVHLVLHMLEKSNSANQSFILYNSVQLKMVSKAWESPYALHPVSWYFVVINKAFSYLLPSCLLSIFHNGSHSHPVSPLISFISTLSTLLWPWNSVIRRLTADFYSH